MKKEKIINEKKEKKEKIINEKRIEERAPHGEIQGV